MNSVGSVKTVTLLGSVATPMEWWRETPISGIDSCRQGSPCRWRWCPRAYAHCAQLGQQSSRRDAADPLYVLWRLAHDHIFRPRSARDGRWREDRKIGAAAHEAIEADLAIPYGCKLTAQETWWRTMLGGRPDGVNNTDARARLERGDKIVEQGVRLCDLVIHVHQDRNVERIQLATADRAAHRGRSRRSAIQDRAPVYAAPVNIRAQHLLR